MTGNFPLVNHGAILFRIYGEMIAFITGFAIVAIRP